MCDITLPLCSPTHLQSVNRCTSFRETGNPQSYDLTIKSVPRMMLKVAFFLKTVCKILFLLSIQVVQYNFFFKSHHLKNDYSGGVGAARLSFHVGCAYPMAVLLVPVLTALCPGQLPAEAPRRQQMTTLGFLTRTWTTRMEVLAVAAIWECERVDDTSVSLSPPLLIDKSAFKHS